MTYCKSETNDLVTPSKPSPNWEQKRRLLLLLFHLKIADFKKILNFKKNEENILSSRAKSNTAKAEHEV